MMIQLVDLVAVFYFIRLIEVLGSKMKGQMIEIIRQGELLRIIGKFGYFTKQHHAPETII